MSLNGQSTEDAQRLVTGQITDININKHILTVRPGPIEDAPRRPEPGSNRGNRGGRRGNLAKTFKVTVTGQTVIKDSVTTITFGMIRVQDRVTIRGLPIKGKNEDLTATEIIVNN